MRRARKWILTIGLIVILLASLLAAFSWSLSRRAPLWWRTTDPTNPKTIAVGTQVEQGVANLLYKMHDDPDAPWSITLHAADANAWLTTRFKAWLANRHPEFDWPDELHDLQVEFADNHIEIGVRIVTQKHTQILSIMLEPKIQADGSLWVRTRWIHLGRLPIPADLLLDASHNSDATAIHIIPARLKNMPETQHLIGSLKGEEALTPNPALNLGDGRRIRLLKLDTRQGVLRVELQTEYADTPVQSPPP